MLVDTVLISTSLSSVLRLSQGKSILASSAKLLQKEVKELGAFLLDARDLPSVGNTFRMAKWKTFVVPFEDQIGNGFVKSMTFSSHHNQV